MRDRRPVLSTPPPGFEPDDVAPPALAPGPWPLSALALDVAGFCNLACRYCAEAATQPQRRPMAPETLNAAWELLCTAGRAPGIASIRLGSGEPLLALPALRRLAGLLHALPEADRPTVFLTTNGTLVDAQMSDWLVTSGWHVKVSLDGPPSVQDAWRVWPDGRGTCAQVADVVADLAARMPDRLSVTAVLCRGADPAEVFEAIARLQVRRIELVPVVHRDASIRPSDADVRRYQAFVDDYARRYRDQAADAPWPVLVRFATRVARVMGYANGRVACGAGRSFLGVGPQGDLYPCFRFVGLAAYRLGDVRLGLERRAVEAFECGPGRAYQERAACRVCWAAPLCGGPCMACAEMFGAGGGEPPVWQCAYTLADARAAVWLVQQLRQRAPERLLSFLPQAGARALADWV